MELLFPLVLLAGLVLVGVPVLVITLVSRSSQSRPAAIPAGWYPDPSTPGCLRWFDGTVWTESRVPAPAVRNP